MLRSLPLAKWDSPSSAELDPAEAELAADPNRRDEALWKLLTNNLPASEIEAKSTHAPQVTLDI